MKIAILGSGGREHAMAVLFKIWKSWKIYCLPGNGGTSELAENIDIDIIILKKYIILLKKIDFV